MAESSDIAMSILEDDIHTDEMFAETDEILEQETDLLDQDINVPKIVLRTSSTTKPEPISDEEMVLLYKTLGMPTELTDKKHTHWRLNSVHIRGVQDMSTSDVLDYFNDFEPDHIEWVNDYSCNVLFSDAKSAATVIAKLSEALVIQKNLPAHDDLPPDIKVIDAESLGISVPPVYWWLGKKTDKSTHVLLRFSTTSDKKMIGARRHSKYYEKYGLPSEARQIFKSRKNMRFSASKLRQKLERIEIDRSDGDGQARLMRADEEQSRASLSSRLGIPITRRLSDNDRQTGRPSVWDRLGATPDEGKIVRRTVEVGAKRFRITSRFSRSGNRPRRSRNSF